MPRGTVQFFDNEKGYGFIEPSEEDSEDGEDVFFHISEVEGFEPEEGDEVTYLSEQGDKGPRAADVRKARPMH